MKNMGTVTKRGKEGLGFYVTRLISMRFEV